MSGYHECDHRAPVAGVLTVFASIEYPADAPPESITIDGIMYVRADEESGDE